jgi:hypothetical protein
VRGVFAIGAIASIFTIDQLYGKIVIMGASIQLLTGLLLFFWFLYILVMAVGVSDDLTVGSSRFFTPGVVELARDVGHFVFMAGAVGTTMMLIFAPLFYLRDHGMWLPAYIVAILLLLILGSYPFIGRAKRAWAKMKYEKGHRTSRRRDRKKLVM